MNGKEKQISLGMGMEIVSTGMGISKKYVV